MAIVSLFYPSLYHPVSLLLFSSLTFQCIEELRCSTAGKEHNNTSLPAEPPAPTALQGTAHATATATATTATATMATATATPWPQLWPPHGHGHHSHSHGHPMDTAMATTATTAMAMATPWPPRPRPPRPPRPPWAPHSAPTRARGCCIHPSTSTGHCWAPGAAQGSSPPAPQGLTKNKRELLGICLLLHRAFQDLCDSDKPHKQTLKHCLTMNLALF